MALHQQICAAPPAKPCKVTRNILKRDRGKAAKIMQLAKDTMGRLLYWCWHWKSPARQSNTDHLTDAMKAPGVIDPPKGTQH